VRKAVADPGFNEKMIATGSYPGASTPEELQAMVRNDIERWGKLIKAAGIKLE
jgi:tripartite-type tricarboxylate transporter receptor subunit TctC